MHRLVVAKAGALVREGKLGPADTYPAPFIFENLEQNRLLQLCCRNNIFLEDFEISEQLRGFGAGLDVFYVAGCSALNSRYAPMMILVFAIQLDIDPCNVECEYSNIWNGVKSAVIMKALAKLRGPK